MRKDERKRLAELRQRLAEADKQVEHRPWGSTAQWFRIEKLILGIDIAILESEIKERRRRAEVVAHELATIQ